MPIKWWRWDLISRPLGLFPVLLFQVVSEVKGKETEIIQPEDH